MNVRLVVIAGALAAGLVGAVPASASEHCTTAAGSVDTPHMVDNTGDWNGLSGTGTGLVPVGDAWRESADIVGAWLAKNAETGKFEAHVRLAHLTGNEANQVIYFLWDWEGSDATQRRRFVSAQFSGRGANSVAYRYGYVGTSATGGGQINEQGGTTGSITTSGTLVDPILGGAQPGEVIIRIPFNRMGDPPVGAELGDPVAETRLSSLTHVWLADDTRDGDVCEKIVLG